MDSKHFAHDRVPETAMCDESLLAIRTISMDTMDPQALTWLVRSLWHEAQFKAQQDEASGSQSQHQHQQTDGISIKVATAIATITTAAAVVATATTTITTAATAVATCIAVTCTEQPSLAE